MTLETFTIYSEMDDAREGDKTCGYVIKDALSRGDAVTDACLLFWCQHDGGKWMRDGCTLYSVDAAGVIFEHHVGPPDFSPEFYSPDGDEVQNDAPKPCPFCGGEAACIADRGHSTAWEIGCYNGGCAAEPSVWEQTKEKAMTAWNARAETAEAAAYRAGVEDALGRIDDFNTLPPDESGRRWRESDLLDQEVMSIRALPVPTPADLAERVNEVSPINWRDEPQVSVEDDEPQVGRDYE